MIVKQPAVAGTLESSDIQVSIFPNPGNGLDIQLQSNAKAQFGDSIIETTAGCTVSCHCGPGTLGVLFVRK